MNLPSRARVRVDADVGAIPERFSLTASNFLGAIRACTPHVPGVVCPLNDTLRARDALWQLYFVYERSLLFGFVGNKEAHRTTFRHQQRITIKAFLCGLVSGVVIGAQVHLEAPVMVCR